MLCLSILHFLIVEIPILLKPVVVATYYIYLHDL